MGQITFGMSSLPSGSLGRACVLIPHICRFEAFDEPWKISLNEPGKEWEDKWGLMDPGRNLKPGLKIPDCGGKMVS